MKLIVQVMTTNNPEWVVLGYTKNLDEAIKWAADVFAQRVNGNTFVNVRVLKQA